jgi:hypothetical protein
MFSQELDLIVSRGSLKVSYQEGYEIVVLLLTWVVRLREDHMLLGLPCLSEALWQGPGLKTAIQL